MNQSIYQLYAELRRKSDELIQLQNTQYSSVKMQVEYENVQKVLMMEVYPSVIKVLKDAGLSPSEMHLCFLTLFKLDSTAISILLNIIPTSVDRTRLRVRKKLNWEGKQGLYESLVNI